MERLPKTFPEAVACIEADKDMPSMLGKKFTSAYLTMKKAEWVDFTSQVTPWEMEKTLDC